MPVILTTSDFKIPKSPQFLEYDVIEMQELDFEAISSFIWAIFHIEYTLSQLYKNELVR